MIISTAWHAVIVKNVWNFVQSGTSSYTRKCTRSINRVKRWDVHFPSSRVSSCDNAEAGWAIWTPHILDCFRRNCSAGAQTGRWSLALWENLLGMAHDENPWCTITQCLYFQYPYPWNNEINLNIMVNFTT